MLDCCAGGVCIGGGRKRKWDRLANWQGHAEVEGVKKFVCHRQLLFLWHHYLVRVTAEKSLARRVSVICCCRSISTVKCGWLSWISILPGMEWIHLIWYNGICNKLQFRGVEDGRADNGRYGKVRKEEGTECWKIAFSLIINRIDRINGGLLFRKNLPW